MTTISTTETPRAVTPSDAPCRDMRGKPDRNCPLCPRLAAFREDGGAREPDWFNAPVASFGPPDARLLIVGLAPGLQGANRTGRPFTGDYAGDLLYTTLLEYSALPAAAIAARPDDGLKLVDAGSPTRCAACRRRTSRRRRRSTPAGLSRADHRRDAAICARSWRSAGSPMIARWRRSSIDASAAPFGHGASHDIGRCALFDSYHCSRYNTNTGVLTPEMFRDVFAAASRAYLGSPASQAQHLRRRSCRAETPDRTPW